jgi:hypothetical protein
MSIIIYLSEFQLGTNVLPKSRIFKFLKRDCGTIPVAEIISAKIEFFSKHCDLYVYLYFYNNIIL